jgi:DnaJ-class molecular chaperone
MTRRSNYSKVRTVGTEGLSEEQVCQTCRGTGEDPKLDGADCLDCWGEGTFSLPKRRENGQTS